MWKPMIHNIGVRGIKYLVYFYPFLYLLHDVCFQTFFGMNRRY